jgi:hypothetical protein
MKLSAVLLVLAVILAGVAQADVTVRVRLQTGNYNTTIDSLEFRLNTNRYMFRAPGLSGAPRTADSADFPGFPEWPDGVELWARTSGQGTILDITRITRDSAYYFNVSAPAPSVYFSMLSGVEEGTSALRPVSGLKASPSLFTGITRLSFNVNVPGKVRAEICDATGRTVRTLIAGERPAGAASALWNARDDAGKAVQPGIYFARVTVGSATATTKLILTD